MYSYQYNDPTAAGPSAGMVLAFVLFSVLLALIVYVVTAIFLSKIFRKAGIEGWKAWVPIYNTWVLLEMGEQPGWLALLLLAGWIPVVGFIPALVTTVFLYIAMYKIGMKFGKGGEFVLLAIFLPIVWVIWLAVDSKAVWNGSKPAADANVPPTTPADPPAPSQPASM